MEHRKLVVATAVPNIRDNEIADIPYYNQFQLLSFSYNLGSRYIEHYQFINKKPEKEEIIERIILFYRTEFLIENYLKQIEELQTKK